jgi:TMEM175 potassium channel family protein
MKKNRLESFSDGVLAIIITIMVLQLGVPRSEEISALSPMIPVFLGYILSFVYVGIYWSNHHYLFSTVTNVTGSILWANLILLFWLSLFPFTTAWMAENHFSAWPTILYGIVLLMASIFYFILQKMIIKTQGKNSKLKKAVGHNYKEKISVIMYIIAICFALVLPRFSQVLYAIVALIWLVPDRRIERIIE